MSESPYDPCAPEVIQAMRTRINRDSIASFERLFIATKNPLYAWEAILHSRAYGMAIPEWCLEYISTCAAEIHKLIKEASTWEYCDRFLDIPFKSNLTYQAAAKAIPTALGITQATRNAFERMSSDRKHREDYNALHSAEILQLADVPPVSIEDELERIRIGRNVESTRAVKNRARRGKTLSNTVSNDPN